MKKSNKLKKFDIKLNQKDAIFVWAFASILIVIFSYTLGYQNITAKTDEYKAKLATAQAKNRELKEKDRNKAKYLEDTKQIQSDYSTTIRKYSNCTCEDSMLLLLRGLEEISGAWIKSTTFSEAMPIYTFGKIASSNTSSDGGRAYSTDMQGYRTTMTVAFEAEYSQWKHLINYINNYYNKNSIDNISVSYNKEADYVSGTMTASMYSITGSNRGYEYPDITVPTGTDNIFNSSAFMPSDFEETDTIGNYILADYDYYMLLHPANTDIDSVIIGKKDDMTERSVIKGDENTSQNVVVKFTGSAGNYKVSYSIGTTQYPAENFSAGQSFDPGPTLDFLLISTKRISADDKAGADITFINETDMELNIKVIDEDTVSPRANIKQGTSGNINVFTW